MIYFLLDNLKIDSLKYEGAMPEMYFTLNLKGRIKKDIKGQQ
jgi:hypothetical protein